MSRYWYQPKYYRCDNCDRRYSAVGVNRDNRESFPCPMCGFDVFPVWEDGDEDSKRNSHTGWNHPTGYVCDNCGKRYHVVGSRGEPFKCAMCYSTVFPRHNR